MKLLNAFSLSMLLNEHSAAGMTAQARFEVLSENDALALARDGFDSFVGHAPTAAFLTAFFGQTVTKNRVSCVLLPGESALIAQYVGPRLPEGATELPPNPKMLWIKATVLNPG